MNIGGFGGYFGILGHYIRFHIEWNTLFKWLDYQFVYDEESNGFIVSLELLKLQLYFCIASNIQDFWLATADSYYIRQDHLGEPPEDLLQQMENELDD